MKAPVSLIICALILAACGGSDKPAATEAAKPSANASSQAATPTVTPATQPLATAKPTANTPLPPDPALLEQAKGVVQKLGSTLKSELETAMQAGGPLNALSICNTRAPEIAKTLSNESGFQVSRVSLKNRNPTMGVASEWQMELLNEFEARKAKGEAADSLVHAEMMGNEFRFIKAIPTSGLCLVCHGATLAPDVSAKIKELYPQDKAIGYNDGDLRGAFVVVKQLAQ